MILKTSRLLRVASTAFIEECGIENADEKLGVSRLLVSKAAAGIPLTEEQRGRLAEALERWAAMT
jgi:hypothetical protein